MRNNRFRCILAALGFVLLVAPVSALGDAPVPLKPHPDDVAEPSAAEKKEQAMELFNEAKKQIMSDPNRAASLFRQSLKLHNSVNTRVAYALALERSGRVCEAYKEYKRAVGRLEGMKKEVAEKAIRNLEEKCGSGGNDGGDDDLDSTIQTPADGTQNAGDDNEAAKQLADEAKKLVVSNPAKAAALYRKSLKLHDRPVIRTSYAFALERAGEECNAYKEFQRALADGLTGKQKKFASEAVAEYEAKCGE